MATFQFGTVGSPTTTPKKPGGSLGAVHHIKELGLGALELGWVQSVRVSEETCAAIRQAAKETGVLLSIHAPYYINLNATFEEWPNARRRLMDAAHMATWLAPPKSFFTQAAIRAKSRPRRWIFL
jgi:deoxyribonuclease-4